MLELITENLPVKTGQLAHITAYVKEHYYKPPDVEHYHTWAHIETMLTELSQVVEEDKLMTFSPRVYLSLYLAVLFHDAQYEPGDLRNELRAMELVRDFPQQQYVIDCGLGSNELVKDAAKMAGYLISSTTTHKDTIKQVRYWDSKAVALLHDLDYMTFSLKSWDDVMAVEGSLRRESIDTMLRKQPGISANAVFEMFKTKRLAWLLILRNTIAETQTMYMCDCFKHKDLQAFINIEKLISLYAKDGGLANTNSILLCN